ncbi:hypothetical protein [Salipiger abyssi]|uniref:hypothetical protein n=1 Tax=Salipiger abyssi TaxID=1250539 RepID=UPI004057DA75
MDDIDIRFFLAFLAPTLGFAIWFVKRVMDERAAEGERETARDNLVRALFAEIDFNTRDMEVFLEYSPSRAYLEKRFAQYPDLIPHITDARHTEIYRNRIREVHGITDGALHLTVNFYGLLEKIRVQVEGVQKPSFATLAPDARVRAVDVIVRTAWEAKLCGMKLLDDLDRDHRALKLKRFEGIGTVPGEELSLRMTALEEAIREAKARHDIRPGEAG